MGGGASAASNPLAQPAPSTPDIENAELTPILPFLFLGNEQDAQDLDMMQRLNIGYVINVTTHLPLYHYEKGLFNYKRLPATDSNKQNLRQYFEEAFEFIGNYLPRGGRIFRLPFSLQPWLCSQVRGLRLGGHQRCPRRLGALPPGAAKVAS